MQEVFLLSWNGARHERQVLSAGLHVVVNSGLEGSDPTGSGDGGDGGAAGVLPAAAAGRRAAFSGAAGGTEKAWGPWVPLVEGAGLDPVDDRALVVRREFGERTWGTTSVSLVGLRAGGVRYDFSGAPGDGGAWVGVVEG